MVGSVALRDTLYVSVSPFVLTLNFVLAVLPYQRHIPSIIELTEEEKTAFAQSISIVTKRYDNLFSSSFAYSMGIHQRPIPLTAVATGEDTFEEAHLHLHFTPPLLRSATVKKFMVGYVSLIASLSVSNKELGLTSWVKLNGILLLK